MDNIVTDPKFGGYIATGLGLVVLGSVVASEQLDKFENSAMMVQ